jgi:hypothetical protein
MVWLDICVLGFAIGLVSNISGLMMGIVAGVVTWIRCLCTVSPPFSQLLMACYALQMGFAAFLACRAWDYRVPGANRLAP